MLTEQLFWKRAIHSWGSSARTTAPFTSTV